MAAPSSVAMPSSTIDEKPPYRFSLGLRFALSAASGVLYFLSYPGLGHWPIAFVALVLLLMPTEGQETIRAMGLGVLAGFAANFLGFYWVYGALESLTGLPPVVCAFLFLGLCCSQGLRLG